MNEWICAECFMRKYVECNEYWSNEVSSNELEHIEAMLDEIEDRKKFFAKDEADYDQLCDQFMIDNADIVKLGGHLDD
jgi:hypothetical protein